MFPAAQPTESGAESVVQLETELFSLKHSLNRNNITQLQIPCFFFQLAVESEIYRGRHSLNFELYLYN